MLTKKTGEENPEGEESPHLVVSCSSRHWRRKSDSGVPGNPVDLWHHKASSAPSLQTAYSYVAPLETLRNSSGKQNEQEFNT